MKFRIVTVSLNQGEFLTTCLNSVLAQLESNDEYVVVDGGSEDDSLVILDSVKKKLRHLIAGSDLGPADGLNKGFAGASADIFGYINADDYYLPGALQAVRKIFAKNPDVDVLFGDGMMINRDDTQAVQMRSTEWNLKAFAFGASPVVQQATFFRRQVFEQAGGFNTSNRANWDAELLVSMALVGARVKHFPLALGVFRVYANSISGSGIARVESKERRLAMAERVLGRKISVWQSKIYKGFFWGKHLLRRPALVWQWLRVKRARASFSRC